MSELFPMHINKDLIDFLGDEVKYYERIAHDNRLTDTAKTQILADSYRELLKALGEFFDIWEDGNEHR